MTADATGPVPDDVIDAVAHAMNAADPQWAYIDFTKEAARAAVDAYLSVPAVAAARTCERDMARLVEERDEAQEWADRLAACAGGPEVIGEHSNVNNPWANALDLLRGDRR